VKHREVRRVFCDAMMSHELKKSDAVMAKEGRNVWEKK